MIPFVELIEIRLLFCVYAQIKSEEYFGSMAVGSVVPVLFRDFGQSYASATSCTLTRVQVANSLGVLEMAFTVFFPDTGSERTFLDDNLSNGVPQNFETYSVQPANGHNMPGVTARCASVRPKEDSLSALVQSKFTIEVFDVYSQLFL